MIFPWLLHEIHGLRFDHGFGIAIAIQYWREADRPYDANKGDFTYNRETTMLRAAILFLVIALIAGLFGLLQVEYISAQIAWVLFVVFLIFAIVSFVFGGGTPRSLN